MEPIVLEEGGAGRSQGVTGEGTMWREYRAIGRTIPAVKTSVATFKGRIWTLKAAHFYHRIGLDLSSLLP